MKAPDTENRSAAGGEGIPTRCAVLAVPRWARRSRLASIIVLGAAAALAGSEPVSASSPTVLVFWPPQVQTWTVPDGVSEIGFTVEGGGGGSGYSGNAGGSAT